MSQSIHATTPSSTGEPVPPGCQVNSANLSPPLVAKVRQMGSCSAARILTQNDPDFSILGQLDEDLSGKNATSGGSSDTEENEPMARPAGEPSSSRPVITTTPVGKWPRTWRKRCWSMPESVVTSPCRSLRGGVPLVVLGSVRLCRVGVSRTLPPDAPQRDCASAS